MQTHLEGIMETSHVVAVGINRVIGLQGQLPWHAPSDLKHFKSFTMGKMLLMGRKTFESVGEPLPGRLNLVVTSQANRLRQRESEHLRFFSSINEAYVYAASCAPLWKNELCIVGGGEIYKQTFHLLDRIVITVIDYKGPGDAFYPEIPSKDFFVKECRILSQETPTSQEPRCELFIYARHSPPSSIDATSNEKSGPTQSGSSGPSAQGVSRRDFVEQVTGYAVAITPVSALAISTPGEGIDAAWTTVETSDKKTMRVYRAFPQKKPPRGLVLVIQEIFGVHEYIQDVCRRLAHEGYAAFTGDLYFRQGDVTKLTSIEEIRQQIVSKVSQTQVLEDLDSILTLPSKQFPSLPVFVTGFCWGGTMTWLYAHHQPKVRSAVAWYGRIRLEKNALVLKEPLDIASSLKVPVLGLYGEKDQGIPLDHVTVMNQKLKTGSTPSSIKVFPQADHGFHADYRPTYHPEAAKQGWKDMLQWFATHR